MGQQFLLSMQALGNKPSLCGTLLLQKKAAKILLQVLCYLSVLFLQIVWYVKLSSVPFPLYIAMMASSPALMISCFVTALGDLFNTSIAVAKLSQAVFFNAIHVPFPNPEILDAVLHPKIALVLVYFYMSMPNFAWMCLIFHIRSLLLSFWGSDFKETLNGDWRLLW